MSRFTGEEIDKLLGHPGPTPDLPESLLARYGRGPRRQPWHQLQEVRDELDASRVDAKSRENWLRNERDRYWAAYRHAAKERDRYVEALRQLAKSADPLTRDKAEEALGG